MPDVSVQTGFNIHSSSFQGQEQKKEQGAIKGRKKKVDRINVEKYHLNDLCPNPQIPEVIFGGKSCHFPREDY